MVDTETLGFAVTGYLVEGVGFVDSSDPMR